MLLVFLSWISYGGLLFVHLYKSTLVPVFLVTLATTLERRQVKAVHASREQGTATLPDSTGGVSFLLSPNERPQAHLFATPSPCQEPELVA